MKEAKQKIEVKSAKYQDQKKKRNQLGKKAYKAEFAQFRARKEMKFAEKGYNTNQLNILEENVKRVVLIKMVKEEVWSAQTQFKKENELTEKIELKGKAISGLSLIFCIKKMKQNNILMK